MRLNIGPFEKDSGTPPLSDLDVWNHSAQHPLLNGASGFTQARGNICLGNKAISRSRPRTTGLIGIFL
jgi:hypothetical protein